MNLQVDVQSHMVRWSKYACDDVQCRGQISGRMQRTHLRMMMEAEAQSNQDHQEQRAVAVAVGAGFIVVRYVTAVLLTTT